MFIIGLADDVYVFRWDDKLVCQVAVCSYAVFIFHLGLIRIAAFDLVLSFLWLVFFTNSFNLLDNMDGLCGGVSVVALAFLYFLTGDMTLLIMVMALLGFMAFNVPGRLWMGDSGSLTLGLFVALKVGQAQIPMAMKLCLLAVPLADTLFVIVERTSKGIPPWRGGKDHLSHRLYGLLNRQGICHPEDDVMTAFCLVAILINAGGLFLWM